MFEMTCKLVGVTPYGQGQAIVSKKRSGEGHDAFEERTWRERLHVDENDEVFIPAQAVKAALETTARYLSETIPGKGKATYTKHFRSGVQVPDNLPLGIKSEKVEEERLFVPSDGRRGSGSRVWKIFPVIRKWEAPLTLIVLDRILKPDKVSEYLAQAGLFVGVGRWRVENGGQYGRWEAKNVKHRELKA